MPVMGSERAGLSDLLIEGWPGPWPQNLKTQKQLLSRHFWESLEQVKPCQVIQTSWDEGSTLPNISKRAERLVWWLKLGSLGIKDTVSLIIIVTKCHVEQFFKQFLFFHYLNDSDLFMFCYFLYFKYDPSFFLVYLYFFYYVIGWSMCSLSFRQNNDTSNYNLKKFCKPLPWIQSYLIYIEHMAFGKLRKTQLFLCSFFFLLHILFIKDYY